MKLRFFVLPPQNVSNIAASLAKRYSKLHPHWFVVDNKNLISHITLFRLVAKKADAKKVIAPIQEFVKSFPKLTLKTDGFIVYNNLDGGGLGLKIKPDKKLTELRRKLATRTKKSIGPSEHLKSYFSPHITLTKFRKHKDAHLLKKKLGNLRKTFKADTIGMGFSDKHGQVHKIIKKFKLRK